MSNEREEYSTYYNEIVNLFENSISTNNLSLKKKIMACLISWYHRNYESELHKCFDEKNEEKIYSISNRIKKVCSHSDYDIVQETYWCKEIDELNSVSNEIFMYVVKSITDKKFPQIDFDGYDKKLKKIEELLPSIVKNKYKSIISECILDLDYLKKKGVVSCYSIRTYNYLKINS